MADPVTLAPADPGWPARYLVERDRLRAALGPDVALEHVGSTAVAGLDAKPSIDLLVGWTEARGEAECLGALASLGYVEEGARPDHRWLCWPAPARRAFIVHLVPVGGPVWSARLTFRDWLRSHLEDRDRYARLKHALAAAHPDDLSAYTAAKFAFVKDVLEAASGRRGADRGG